MSAAVRATTAYGAGALGTPSMRRGRQYGLPSEHGLQVSPNEANNAQTSAGPAPTAAFRSRASRSASIVASRICAASATNVPETRASRIV